jgi:hypothetical protein
VVIAAACPVSVRDSFSLVLTTASESSNTGIVSAAVLVKILWLCDTCGALGGTDADLPCDSLDQLTIEQAATALLDALRAVPHPHPVQPRPEILSS